MIEKKYYEELMEMQPTELVDLFLIIESQLRDATDLLNDCGYYIVNGRWEDSENPLEGEEE